MDSYQQSHGYPRPPLPPPPPLPSMADPHHHHQFPPPPRQPISQQGPWYSGGFQYHPPHLSSSPPPPPHHHQTPPSQQQQWAPPPPYSDQYPPAAYPLPHHNPVLPYPTHQQPLHNQYPPPPRPHMPPPPPHQSYHQVNQEWGNPNWGHHQGLEFPVQSNEEDWASRARAWAAAKASTDNQNVSQSTPFNRVEEQVQYHDQHPQSVDSHHSQTQQQAYPLSSFLQFPAAPTHRSPVVHQQEFASISSGLSSYVPNGHSSYTTREETSAGDSNAVLLHRESLPTSPTFHQQEVPCSYSSVTGKGGAVDQAEVLYKSLPFPITSHQEGHQHVQSLMPATNGRSEFMEQPFAYRNRSADLSDQPLDFVPSSNRVYEPQMQSSFPQHDTAGPIRGMDPVAAASSIHAWAPPGAPGIVYPPVLPSGPVHDPSMAVYSSTPLLGRFSGPDFQLPVPSVSAPFGLGAGPALHSTTAFPGDAYGYSSIPDRPKKAAVPNWLREEIIKKKAVIASSAQEHSKEDTQSIEDEGVEKSFGKGDQADSKSIDYSRSIEEEDDDEDYVEAARTAAINQEIKRILTEVLLKVTDELFDEIATKVLSEADVVDEVNHAILTSNHKASLSPPAVPTPNASAKVLIPVKPVESETRDVTEKSSSSTPGDLLGLGSYASDDDDEINTSSMPNSRENSVHQHSFVKKRSEDIHDAGENGSSQVDIGERNRYQAHLEIVSNKSTSGPKTNKSAVTSEMDHNNVGHTNSEISGITGDVTNVGGKMIDDIKDSELQYTVEEKNTIKSEMPGKEVNAKNLMSDSQGRETSTKLDKNGSRYENKRSSAEKDSVKEVESSKIRIDWKGGESRVKQDEIHLRKENKDDRNGSKGKKKEEGASPEKKIKESDSKKYSHIDVEDDRYETERGKRASANGDNGKKRERVKDEKEDRLRHKPQSDSSRHKRRRSSSLGSRGRNGKDIYVVGYSNDTSDEASDDSRRKRATAKGNGKKRERVKDEKEDRLRHKPQSDSSRYKRRRSPSPGSRGRNGKDISVVSHSNDTSDEASDDSRRKLHSKRRNLSPSAVKSRRRQLSRSPHKKHSQRRHSPYSSLETTRKRRSRSRSPVRRQR